MLEQIAVIFSFMVPLFQGGAVINTPAEILNQPALIAHFDPDPDPEAPVEPEGGAAATAGSPIQVLSEGSLYFLKIDLQDSRVKVRVGLANNDSGGYQSLYNMKSRYSGQGYSEWAIINGDYFGSGCPSGVNCAQGLTYIDGNRKDNWSAYGTTWPVRSNIGFDSSKSVQIAIGDAQSKRNMALAGGPWIVKDGGNPTCQGDYISGTTYFSTGEQFTGDQRGYCSGTSAATMAGYSSDRRYLFIGVSSGGMTVIQIGQWLKDRGAFDVIKLDGGGSSGIYFNNSLMKGSGARAIANHLAVTVDNAPPPPSSGSWKADYYDNQDRWWDNNNPGNFKCSETINGPGLDKSYGSNAPCGGMDGDTWIGDYSATINFPSGNYAFWVEHDDGLKVWLNGQNIADRGGSGSTWICPARYLSGDNNLRVMLREDGGDAKVKLSWTTDTSGCNSTPKPSANFDASPQSGTVPLTVVMHIVDMANLSSCFWNYGDGQTSTTCTQTHDHIYTNPGLYTVSLTVDGPGGSDSMTRSNYVTATQVCYSLNVSANPSGAGSVIKNPGPNCSGDQYSQGTDVQLTASPAGGYSFGSWSGDVGGSSNPTNVTMNGNKNVSANFIFQTPPPSANFDAWPQSGNAPLTVAMHIVNMANISGCSWNYGDGQTSTICTQVHDHIYTSSGSYTVSLTVNGPGGSDSMTLQNYITVTSPPGPFAKISPANTAAGISINPTLSWETSAGATGYEYCYDTTNDNACSNWTSNGTATSKALSGLSQNTIYYWHVRAVSSYGTTYANGGSATAFWSFATQTNDDNYEENDTLSTAYDLSALEGTWLSTINGYGVQADDDWYRIYVTPGYEEVVIDVRFTHSEGDIDIALYNSAGNKLTSSESTTNKEYIDYIVPAGGTYYYINVYYGNRGNQYDLWWDDLSVPTPPGVFNKTLPSNGAIVASTNPVLSWETSTGAASYEYCYDSTDDNACAGNWISTGANTSVNLSGLSNNATYSWQVRAVNADGITYANSSTWWRFATSIVITPPGMFAKSGPANAVTGITTNPVLSWGTSNNAAGYEYCYDTTNDSACNGAWTSAGTSTSVTLTGLSYNSTYYWQVRAVNAGGIAYANDDLSYPAPSSSGIWWKFTTGIAPPSAFTKSSPANSSTEITLTPVLRWDTSSGATGYEYCYDTTNDTTCSGIWTGAGTNTSVTLSGVSINTIYYWQVRATNAGGTTYANAGIWWNFTTMIASPGAFAKSSPSNSATGIAVNPAISWGTSSRAARYEYCYDLTNDDACSGTWINVGTNTSATLAGLSNDTTYYWQVRAINPGGTTYANDDLPYPAPGSSGVWWKFKTIIAPPALFAKSSPSNSATRIAVTPVFSWGTSSRATSYEYCYDITNDNACSGTWISNGTSTSATLTGLSYNTTYYWQVRAVNAGGITYANDDFAYPVPASSGIWWSFTTIIAPPGPYAKSSPTNSVNGIAINPLLSWGASSGAEGYEYCYDTTNDNSCSGTWIGAGTNTSVTLAGLSTNTTYYWQVRATNAGGITYANGGTWWNFTTIVALPGPFAKSDPIDTTTGISLNLVIRWGTSSRATGYEYCYDTTNDNACSGVWISAGANTSATLSGLSYNTTYYWQVRATNSSGTTYANDDLAYPAPASNGIWWKFTTLSSAYKIFLPFTYMR